MQLTDAVLGVTWSVTCSGAGNDIDGAVAVDVTDNDTVSESIAFFRAANQIVGSRRVVVTNPAHSSGAEPDHRGAVDDAPDADVGQAGMLDLVETCHQRSPTLVRAGRVRQATLLEPQKSDLASAYMKASVRLSANRQALTRHVPNELRILADLHRELQARLKTNMTVLATAHAVSEDIIRGVSTELQRKASPSTYGASGRTSQPSPRTAQPLAVSRSI